MTDEEWTMWEFLWRVLSEAVSSVQTAGARGHQLYEEKGILWLTYKKHGMFSCKLEPLCSVELTVFLKQRKGNGLFEVSFSRHFYRQRTGYNTFRIYWLAILIPNDWFWYPGVKKVKSNRAINLCSLSNGCWMTFQMKNVKYGVFVLLCCATKKEIKCIDIEKYACSV